MDISLFLRYTAENAMIIPAAVSAVLPVRSALKHNKVHTALSTVPLLIAYILIGAEICTKFEFASNTALFFGMAVFFILYSFNVSYSLPKRLFCFFHGAALAGFATMYTAYLGAPFEIGEIGLYTLKWGCIALAIGIGITLLFFRDSFFKLHDLFENENMDRIWKALLFVPFLIVLFSIWVMPIDYSNVMIGRVRKISLILFPVILLVYHLIIHILWWTSEHITKESELKRQNDLFQLEEKRYKALRYYSEQASMIRHDFRHHIGVISELLNSDKTDEAKDYLRQFTETDFSGHKLFCRNQGIDAIAAHYDKIARQNGIQINWHLKLGEQLPFRISDVCAITGNLVENAINAVRELSEEKRIIDLTMEMRTDQMLALFIRNPYENAIIYDKHGLPKSSQANHGIGLHSVFDIVKAHNGNLQIETENGIFAVSIIIFEQKDKGAMK